VLLPAQSELHNRLDGAEKRGCRGGADVEHHRSFRGDGFGEPSKLASALVDAMQDDHHGPGSRLTWGVDVELAGTGVFDARGLRE
jgi:hypothetical protein